MQHIKHAVISAAGLGSRLGVDIPKCLIEVNGRKLIEYQLDVLKDIPDVRIVVGFKEKELIQYVSAIRKDIVFVRNPDYAATSNSYSLNLATRELKDPFLMIDGDLLISHESFQDFLEDCREGEDLIGVAEAKTEEAVFVKKDGDMILEFSFEKKTDLEWCGIAYLANIKISAEGGYIFKEFESHLPLRSREVRCYEIDTPEDLALARKYAERGFA